MQKTFQFTVHAYVWPRIPSCFWSFRLRASGLAVDPHIIYYNSHPDEECLVVCVCICVSLCGGAAQGLLMTCPHNDHHHNRLHNAILHRHRTYTHNSRNASTAANNYCYYNHFTALWILYGTTRVSQYEKRKCRKVKPIWIYWSKR